MNIKERFTLFCDFIKIFFPFLYQVTLYRLFHKIKILFYHFFKTPSARLFFHCSVLICIMLFMGIQLIKIGDNNASTVLSYCVVGLLIVFFLWEVLGHYQLQLIRYLEAELVRDDVDLIKKVRFFAEKANIPIPSVYLTHNPYLVALSIGGLLGGNILIISSKTLSVLDSRELDCIIAHEIGHLKFSDARLQVPIIFSAFIIFLIFWQITMKPINFYRETIKGIKSSYKWYENILYFWGIIVVLPLFFFVLILGFPIRSIFFEQDRRADIFSAHATGDPLGLIKTISVLSKNIQSHENFSLFFFLNFSNPSSCKWELQKMFDFLCPSDKSRIRILKTLDDMGIIPKMDSNNSRVTSSYHSISENHIEDRDLSSNDNL